MPLLDRSAILNAQDLMTEDIEVPEWGGSIRLRTLTGTDRDKFEADSVEHRGGSTRMNLVNMRARLVSLCAVDEEGKLLFASKEDVQRLGGKSSLVLAKLFDKCREMNGMSEAEVEELAEGFDDAPSEDSTSD